jgi:hypothetical protein
VKVTKKELKKIILEELKNYLSEGAGATVEDVVAHLQGMPPQFRHSVMNDWHAMAEGNISEWAEYYPHIPAQELPSFAQAVLDAMGE